MCVTSISPKMLKYFCPQIVQRAECYFVGILSSVFFVCLLLVLFVFSVLFCRVIMSCVLSFSRTLRIFDTKMTCAISAFTKTKSLLSPMVSNLGQ